MTLVNKYVFISNGHYYKFGQIVEKIDDKEEEFFLVNIFSPGHKNDTQLLYNIAQMMQLDEESEDNIERSIWLFFNDIKALNKYIKKIETPSKKEIPKDGGKVINFNRK